MSTNGMEVREVSQMSDASRSRRRGLVLRFVLIALMVLAVNTLIQLFIGASLGVVENVCWLVSATLLGWAGSFGHDRLSGEWPGAEQDAAEAVRAAPSEPASPAAGSPGPVGERPEPAEPAPVGTGPAPVEPAPPTEPVMPRPGPVDEASSQPTPIDPVRVDPAHRMDPTPKGSTRGGPAPAASLAPPTPAPPTTGRTRPTGTPPAMPPTPPTAAAPTGPRGPASAAPSTTATTGQTRPMGAPHPMGPPPAVPGVRRRRASGRWFRR